MSTDRFQAQRRALIGKMQERGIRSLEILRAFDQIPRHLFLPAGVQHVAYEDAPVHIGHAQTASQPSLQALYMQILEIGPRDKVLEIGTGSGHQTAVLAQLADRVYSVERIRDLSIRARDALDALRISNVALLVGDGTIGWSRYAPYDAILVAAAAPDIPQPLVDQLAPGGRMLVPVGARASQRLLLVTREADGGTRVEDVAEVTFVPLLGRFGWAEEAPPPR